MKKIIYILIIIPILIAIYIYLLFVNKSKFDETNKQRLDNLEQKVEKLSIEISILKSIKSITQTKQIELLPVEEIINTKKIEVITGKSNKSLSDLSIKTKDTIKTTEEKTIPTISSKTKELGYIEKIYSDSMGNKKINVDYIELLPSDECVPAIVCFKNETRKTYSLLISDDVEINIKTFSYLINVNDYQNINLSNFQLMFNSDHPQEKDEYNEFKEIPYWITIKNNKVIRIEEQEIK